jgi:hypothetical protein
MQKLHRRSPCFRASIALVTATMLEIPGQDRHRCAPVRAAIDAALGCGGGSAYESNFSVNQSG